MIRTTFARKLLGAALALSILACAGAAGATPMADFSGRTDSFNWTGENYTLGYQFRVNNPIAVNAFGLFDFQGDGLAGGHDIALWTDAGALIVQTTIGPGASAPEASISGLGNWVFQDIASLTLGTGIYRIGATYHNDDVVVWNANGINSVPDVTYLSLAFDGNNGVLTFPTGGIGAGADRYFGPNLRIASVPEPASLALVGLGLFGLVLNRRRVQFITACKTQSV